MRAWAVGEPGPLDQRPLRLVERPSRARRGGGARPGAGLRRTDLHLAEGDLPVRRASTVPGHEVGEVTGLGPGAHRFAAGDRVGIAWLRHLRHVPLVPQRPREPLRAVAVHRVGR